jgi:hypothetical protein
LTSAPSDRSGLGLVAALAAASAWIAASAASQRRGFVVFAVLALGIAGAWRAARRGRRGTLYATAFGLLLCASGVLGLEVVLHLWPGVLGGAVANVAYTGYHWQRGGIYRLDAHRGVVIRPSVHRRLYWNGHWWSHTANEDGYRGPRVSTADAVFLGDSMVYGHGVDDDRTLAAYFSAVTGLAAANLGQQGTCQLQSLLTWRAVGRALRPRYVFASVHFTDLAEIDILYEPEEQRRFREETGYLPLAVVSYRPRPWWDPIAFWSTHLAAPLRVSGILGTLVQAARAGKLRHATRDEDAAWSLPTEENLSRPFPTDGPGWATERHALARLQQECTEAGARLVLFDIGYPRAFTAEVESIAGQIGADYSPAGRVVLARGQGGEDVYLKNDGHWTPLGNDLMARELAGAVGAALLPQAGVR